MRVSPVQYKTYRQTPYTNSVKRSLQSNNLSKNDSVEISFGLNYVWDKSKLNVLKMTDKQIIEAGKYFLNASPLDIMEATKVKRLGIFPNKEKSDIRYRHLFWAVKRIQMSIEKMQRRLDNPKYYLKPKKEAQYRARLLEYSQKPLKLDQEFKTIKENWLEIDEHGWSMLNDNPFCG